MMGGKKGDSKRNNKEEWRKSYKLGQIIKNTLQRRKKMIFFFYPNLFLTHLLKQEGIVFVNTAPQSVKFLTV